MRQSVSCRAAGTARSRALLLDAEGSELVRAVWSAGTGGIRSSGTMFDESKPTIELVNLQGSMVGGRMIDRRSQWRRRYTVVGCWMDDLFACCARLLMVVERDVHVQNSNQSTGASYTWVQCTQADVCTPMYAHCSTESIVYVTRRSECTVEAGRERCQRKARVRA